MSVKELRGITPTFQAVLNKQIGKAMDAIDEGLGSKQAPNMTDKT